MAVKTYDDLIKRISDGYGLTQPIYGDFQTARSSIGTIAALARAGYTKAMPTLPSGVTGYRLNAGFLMSKTDTTILIAKQVLLGTLDISGASGTFTDGAVMPTTTSLGASLQQYGGLLLEITTVLNATPGTLSITWNDQGGTSRNTTTALPASGVVSSAGLMYTAGSQGVRDVTAMSRSAGTTPTGIVKAYGLIPLAHGPAPTTGGYINNLTWQFNDYLLGAADEIGIFSNVVTATGLYGSLSFIGES